MIADVARRWLPQSLFGRTLAILLAGLVVSYAIGAWIYAGAREQAVRAVGGYAAAQRIANLARLVNDAPPDWRPRIVQALSEAAFRVELSTQAPSLSASESEDAAETIRLAVLEQLPEWSGREAHVAVADPAGPGFGRHFGAGRYGGPMGGMMREMMGPGFGGGFGVWRSLHAAVRLSDGRWLVFATALPQGAPSDSWRFAAALGIMAILVLAVSAWAVRGVTSPLAALAAAADRFGRDVGASPLPETGAAEIRTAAHAFNHMQERLKRLIESRTQMLAAISHDLRTPLTLLRLRAEEALDGAEREKMLATISDMDSMVGSTLAFARDEARAEQRRRVDLAALVASIVDDMSDAGLPVEMQPAAALPYECQSESLKRVVANLVDNAIKYGRRADVKVARVPGAVEIAVDDKGPGIPERQLQKVFQPFYRLEESRSRETGGVGLGLAIAQSIVQAHGGELTLANRAGGGLRALVRLPE
ncbi:MAG: HAMP domain-containing protein [Rhodoblastus sp.]|nr:HAMP domain-containing protein [Rhodoblastus sp.]